MIPGDEVRYTITFENDGPNRSDAGTVVITNPVPENTQYIADSAFGSGTTIQFSVDGGKTFHPANELTVVRDGAKVPATPAGLHDDPLDVRARARAGRTKLRLVQRAVAVGHA